MISNKNEIEALSKEVRSKCKRKNQYDVLVSVEDLPRGSGSLYLQINPSGTMKFRFLQRVKGAREFTVIAPYCPDNLVGINLAKAREKARALAKTIHGLLGNKSLKKHKKEVELREKANEKITKLGTLRGLIQDYTAHMKLENKRTYTIVQNELTSKFNKLLDVEVASISSNDICIVLGSLIERGAEVQSNRVRSYIMAAINFGIKFDHDPRYLSRDKKYQIKVNPVTSIPRQSSAEKVRDRVLSTSEITQLFEHLKGGHFSKQVGLFIHLLLLTGGQRPYELSVSQWSDIDFEKAIWTIRSSVAKNGKLHLVPLVESALEQLKILQDCSGNSEYIFPKNHSFEQAMPTSTVAQAIRKYYKTNAITSFQPKDFRRTLKTKLGELGVDKLTRDRLQNHTLQDVSSRHYDRYDYLKEKRIAVVKWENWLINLNKAS
jgi:integrase